VNPDPAEIARRIARGEGKELEFKRGLPRDSKTARTLCAFANTRGGLLLVGVGDRGEILGAPHPRETLERLRAIGERWVDPPLRLQLGLVELQARRLVWCSVPLSPLRPHVALGEHGERTILARVGSSNRRATGATLATIKAQRSLGTGLSPLEREVLAWVSARPTPATVAAFARASNVGRQRARRAFTRLELAGRLVAHGQGAQRAFELP